ncbi:MAG: glycoside hydrolase family 127 protein [Acidobacteria bacterium]|nr:glycoside hydrolase family 127 protein [Acidobacteriota bacterium]
MRQARIAAVILLLAAGTLGAAPEVTRADYPTSPVPLIDVTFTDTFWAPRIETVRTVTIPAAFKQSEETGRIRNFEIAGGLATGAFCSRYAFDDSDVYKIIEGASYALATRPDPALDTYLDGVIAKIAKAQEPDGYIYTARTIDPAKTMPMAGKERWINEEESHELYNAGHLYEAAVAHAQATGKKTLLDVALKNADLVCRVFNLKGRRAVPGHQEIEIGLVKLYRLTGNRTYLDQAAFFLDQRGRADGHKLYGEYAQDHKPVADQTEAVGHSVRAAYMYSAMADVAALTGNTAYVAALDKLWDNVVSKKLYLTGGIGATGAWEGFGPDYDLPNSAYAETCASIANALWNHRMFLLKQDGRYMDVYERAVYNAMLSGLSLSGDRFFYPNPLLSMGQHERSPWFACACCPSNLPRFILSVPGHAYAVDGADVFVNLYVQGRATIKTNAGAFGFEVKTNYPWAGDVRLVVTSAPPEAISVHWRVPGWAQGHPVPGDLYRDAPPARADVTLQVNSQPAPSLAIEKGYLSWRRTWKAGDAIDLHLPMAVRRVVAHPAVKADEGRVAVERGPLVYTAEFVDNGGRVTNLVLDDATPLATQARPDLLGGITLVTGRATALRTQGGSTVKAEVPLTLIPYYAWAHRGKGEMVVWLARKEGMATPAPEPTLASLAKDHQWP